MKNLKRFSAVAGALAVLAVAFSSCGNVVDTELDFAEKEKELIGDQGPATTAKTATVKVGGFNLKNNGSSAMYPFGITASKRTTLTVTIDNSDIGSKVAGKSSVKKAISFWTVAENGDHYWKMEAELPYEIVSVTEGANTSTFECEVDTSSVTTNFIAVFADAKKLKDKAGTLILNSDGSYKSGEESDSVIAYLTVDYKADGTDSSAPTATTAITKGIGEWFAPTFAAAGGAPYIESLVDSSHNPTGKYQVRIRGTAAPKTAWDATPTDVDNFADVFSKGLILRTREATSSSKKDISLEFKWNSDDARYDSQEIALDVGTYYELYSKNVNTSSAAAEWTGWYKEHYGHEAVLTIQGTGASNYIDGTAKTANIYTSEPTYIIDGYDSSATEAATWTNKAVYFDSIASAQQSFVDISNGDDDGWGEWNEYRIYPRDPEEVLFESDPKDIKVILYTDDGNPYELPFKVGKKLYDANWKNSEGKYVETVEYYTIEITDKNFNMPGSKYPEIWFGNGVTLKSSSNVAHPTQVHFGKFKDKKDGILSGYVRLY